MPETSKNRIEDIKRHLYDREDVTIARRTVGVLHPIAHKVSNTWQAAVGDSSKMTPPLRKPPTSFFKKFFWGALIFFIGAVGFGAYMYFSGGISVSNDNIDIVVLGNAFTKGGEELPLQVEIINRNNASLELANLIIQYPRGANNDPTDVVRLPRDSIGTIKAGQSVTRNIKVKLFGEEKSIRNIKISLEYHPEGSNAIFTKDNEYGVTISSAPLSLIADIPDTATTDQLFTFEVTTKLNTSLPSEGSVVQVAYPNGFVFDSAIPEPMIGNSIWSLASLSQTNPVKISIRGKVIGQPDDEQVFHVYAGTTSIANATKVNVVYNSLLETVKIVKPFLEAQILVNGKDSSIYSVSGGEVVNAEIFWTNNLSSKITDAEIYATISGNAFDRNTINPGEGFYNSATNKIFWDKNTISDLASVEPGARGSVRFSFKTNSFAGTDNATKDPNITLDVSIRGRQASLGSIFSDISNVSKKVIKIASDFQIATSGAYHSGSLPPKAEQETRYTVNWTLSNSSNSITQAQAKAALPVYVKWVGKSQGTTENISYNETTREVIWNIGTVRPNTGFDTNREASFVVSLVPSLSQVGSVPQLVKDVYLSGTDSFAGTVVKSTRGPLTTFLPNDPRFKNGNERVVN